MRVVSTADKVAREFKQRADATPLALTVAMRVIAAKVDRDAVANLSGGGAPGAYPVPRRSGNLSRSIRSQTGQSGAMRFAEIGTIEGNYGPAVHNGFHAYGNPNAPYYGPRPYLDDAAEKIDMAEEVDKAMERLQ